VFKEAAIAIFVPIVMTSQSASLSDDDAPLEIFQAVCHGYNGRFGPNRDEVTGGERKLHNEELHNLYSSPSIIRVVKSRRMRWTKHVARMGEKRTVYMNLVGRP
jgi:hypothetical protein